MKLKTGLKLRKVGDRYMLVDVSEHDMNVTAVHTTALADVNRLLDAWKESGIIVE